MDRIEKCVELFLARNYSFKNPLVLALSGGVDSSVLCSILLYIKQKRDFDLRIVHIDHSWRKESSIEAKSLLEKFQKLHIPISVFTLEAPQNFQNAEENARNKRLTIFQKIAAKLKAEAVLLAHQQDDLAETMLKRIFEGAPIPFWHGIEEVSSYNDTILWRPLLSIPKKEIVSFAESRKIPYFIDSTGEDLRFLRNRMRANLIPSLETSFGKSISTPLSSLREQSNKLKKYLRQKTAFLHELLETTNDGFVLDLKKTKTSIFAYEIEFFLTELCRKESFQLSASQKEAIANLLSDGRQEALFTTSSILVRIRGKRAAFEKKISESKEKIPKKLQIVTS